MSAPKGWILVPIEPTRAMTDVYKKWHREGKGHMDVSIWKAMLDAAPNPAEQAFTDATNRATPKARK